MQDINISRRDMLKTAVAGVAGIALASAGLAATPKRAFADTADGTYTVTANLYVAAKDSPIGKDAYVTNPKKPPLQRPTEPVSNNATLVVAGGKKLLTVPIVNEVFGVTSFPAASEGEDITVEAIARVPWIPTDKTITERISSITFDVTNCEGTSVTADFSPCTEYADFILFRGNKDWDLHLVADLAI